MTARQQLQQQMGQLALENQGLRDRAQAAEQRAAMTGGGSGSSAGVLQALSRLPEILEKMSRKGGGGLISQKRLGKPQKLEDYVAIGGKTREVLE